MTNDYFYNPLNLTNDQCPMTNDRFYKTGDLARWLPDGPPAGGASRGVIEFLGRIDSQVKIRGFRIELNEIENHLAQHQDVKVALVTTREDESGTKFLCAYIVEKVTTNQIFIPGKYRTYLLARLPGYMIPTHFINLNKIPLTPTGKIDRNALPDPLRLTNETTDAAPGSEMEKKLVEIWQNVLGRETIGINENFFLIGGDSIKSIQILSRINQAGYKIEMKELFEYPTIAKLAPKIKPFANTSEQITITGRVPLTPVQAWFFEKFHTAIHHFNQSVMFYARDGFDERTINAVFTKIQGHHDALRMTYKKENGEIIQINHGLDYPLSLTRVDLRNRGLNANEIAGEITGQANLIQSGINLETGPLMKLGLFHLDDGDRLLIVIHHLAADGVSWRILFEDLETLFRQHRDQEPLSLPLKTDAFKTWAEKLVVYADSDAFLKEKNYWAGLESLDIPVIERDFPAAGNYRRDEDFLSFRLNEKETEDLLTRANNAFGTEINDILLAALAAAIKKTWGHDRTAVALEGHGREEIMPGMDIARTFGWFTTGYPVVLNASPGNNPAQLLKEIKETTRKIPHKGIGYGILKYLTDPLNKKDIQFKLHPQIGFNYLGQFDADIKRLPFEIAQESSGETISLACERELDFEISGMIANNGLVISLCYNQKHYKKKTVETLLDHYHSQLKNLVDFCVSRQKREWTPSDFTYSGLSIEMIDKLCGRYNLEDIYLLTPMQEGMLFHAIYDHTSASYFEQSSYRLQGELDPIIVNKSLNELFRRHDILRTAFIHELPGRPVQLVLKDRQCDFHYRDIRYIEKREDKESFVSAFKAADKKRVFNLSQDVLVRVAIFRLDEAEYEFTWSFHHILMDGWCIGILNSEFFEIYTAYIENRSHRLTPLKPYRTYIQWLEKQDREASAQYWKTYLDSFTGQTGVPQTKIQKQEAQEVQYKDETHSILLDGVKTAALQRLAADNHVTLNILTQALWGILLGKYNAKEDVVFGAVVSGRPFELEGVESMVGLFINTIPVRVRFDPAMKFQALLEITQAEAVAGERHHYHPLAEIQAATLLKQNLIDHIFVFENYPVIEQLEQKSNHFLKITNADVFEQTNYNFNIILAGSGRLSITFKYNAHTYERDFIEQLAGHFLDGLNQVSENPGLSIWELEFLSETEKNFLLYSLNEAVVVQYPRGKMIHQLFEEQIARTPDYIALHGCMIAWMHDCMDAWMDG
ncbi:MAG: condensation domain-containing protein, partial [Acidobacteria bacterium]|nr:condensation domain-containing protein [Acidobacteriota bacterium]